MSTLIGAVLGAVFAILSTILYDRYKRPTPNYNFTFEKKFPIAVPLSY